MHAVENMKSEYMSGTEIARICASSHSQHWLLLLIMLTRVMESHSVYTRFIAFHYCISNFKYLNIILKIMV